MPHYRYQVCKGQKVLALSTTKREAEDEARRVGGRVEALPEKNPADQTETPEFKRWFGNSKVVDAQGKPLVVYHGTRKGGFTAFDKSKIDAWHHGFFFTDSLYMASSYSSGNTGDAVQPLEYPTAAAFVEAVHNVLRHRGDPAVDPVVDLTPDLSAWIEWGAWGPVAALKREGVKKTLYEARADWDGQLESLYGFAKAHAGRGVYSVYLSFQNPLKVDAGGLDWDSIPVSALKNALTWEQIEVVHDEGLLPRIICTTDDICSVAAHLGYDSAIIRNCTDYGAAELFEDERPADIFVAFSPTQIKSANHNRGTFDPHDADIRNPASPTHIPPAAVAAAARKGLEMRASQPPSNRCCTSVGLRRAAQLANRQPVSEDTMRRMLSYFQRHEVDKRGKDWGAGSRGEQAWLAWGGDPGFAWVKRVLGEPSRNPADQTETPEFKRWFGNSKVVDAQGRPLVVYHGTMAGGFTKFLRTEHHGFFFTDSPKMAASWATGLIQDALVSIDEFPTRKELDAAIDRSSWGGVGVPHTNLFFERFDTVEGGRRYVLTDGDNNPIRDWSDSTSGWWENLKKFLAGKEQRRAGLYFVFLSFQNPLEFDAKGANWNKIPVTAILRVLSPADRKAALDVFRGLPRDFETGEPYCKSEDAFVLALQLGFDSVIIRNSADYGDEQGKPATVFIASRSEQIKSANHNRGTFDPHDADIRNPATEYPVKRLQEGKYALVVGGLTFVVRSSWADRLWHIDVFTPRMIATVGLEYSVPFAQLDPHHTKREAVEAAIDAGTNRSMYPDLSETREESHDHYFLDTPDGRQSLVTFKEHKQRNPGKAS